MRIRIIAIGSQGDVQPLVALGLGLQSAGHAVRIATHVGFEPLVRRWGLEFSPVAGDPRPVVESDAGRAWMDKDRSDIVVWRDIGRWADRLMRQRLADCWQGCLDADAILASPLGLLAGYHIAEKLQIPLVRIFLSPATPTRAYPAAFVPGAFRLGGRLNLWSHRLAFELLWLLFRSKANVARRAVLGLAALPLREPFGAMDRRRWPLLYGYSAAVVPPPPDWGDWVHVTGYWFLDRPPGWRPPAGLVDFLAAGPPPVYVGFGSMSNRAPEETARLVARALRRAGRRGVLLTGWGGLGDAGSDAVYAVDGVPHDWLFPRVAAAVHHGGAGTTAAALRAGVPSVVVPFFADQRFWGRRVQALGAGPPPLARARLTVAALAGAIEAATGDAGMRGRAAALGERLRAEDGIARAVDVVNARLGAPLGAGVA